MAEKAKNKDNKNLIIGICAVIAIVVVVVFAVVLSKKSPVLNDAYFVSDGEKLVMTMEMDVDDDESISELEPVKTHVVYFYSGDKITGAKAYYEYKTADQAKAAFDAAKSEGEGEDMSDISLDGKYIVLTADKTEYEGLTVDEVKSQIESMESINDLDLDDYDYEGED